MNKTLTFLKKQWFSILLLVGVTFGVVIAVQKLRPRGSMSVVEAQAMDMTLMKPPIGVFPVGADYALERMVGGSETFPATIQALNDENIVARVPGLVSQVLVYPGDQVKAGQLLAKLSAPEYDQRSNAESLAAAAARARATAAESMIQQERAAVARARTEIKTAEAGLAGARAELKAAQSELQQARKDVDAAVSAISEAQAEATYAEANYQREEQLYKGGAISRNELDQARKALDSARAKVEGAQARAQRAREAISAKEAKAAAAQSGVDAAAGRVATSRAMVDEALARLSRAQSEASAARTAANAAQAGAGASAFLTSYLELRASSDGVVTERVVSPGTPVTPGQTVLKVKTNDELRVQADLPQRLAGKVMVGSTVRISHDDGIWDAQITSIFPQVEGQTRTFRVEAKIPNPGRAWDVGAYVEMEVFTAQPERVLSVRNEALKTASDGGHYVWLVTESEGGEHADNELYTCTMHPDVIQEGPGICPICKMDLVPKDARGGVTVQRRVVEVGVSDGRYTEITGGLEEGDQVTYAGDDSLFPGAAIEVVEWGEDGPMELPKAAGGGTDHSGHAMPEEDGHDHSSGDSRPERDRPTGDHDHAGTLYTCPMHPEVVKDEPGICPICKMDLVPMEGEGQ